MSYANQPEALPPADCCNLCLSLIETIYPWQQSQVPEVALVQEPLSRWSVL